MNGFWKEQARKHTDYTRQLVELSAQKGMVSIECALYLYEQALIHGWKHAEEYYQVNAPPVTSWPHKLIGFISRIGQKE